MISDVKIEFDNTGNGPLKVPGLNGVCLGARPLPYTYFAGLAHHNWLPAPFTARELQMLKLMNFLTERPGWEGLVFDASSVQNWRTEAVKEFPLISSKAWDWCVSELRDKAERYQETGLIMVLNAGAGVCKSDIIIPPTVRTEIKDLVASASKDRKIGAIQQIWNLVDPSLYPLTCGNTRVLLNGGSVLLDQTLGAYGQGEVAPLFYSNQDAWEFEDDPYSQRYQWLPCEVEFCGPSGSTDVRITSYINNLHPHEQRPLYETLENVISRTIEPWNEILIRRVREHPRKYWHTVGRDPLRIQELPKTLDVDRSSEDYQRSLDRVKEYLKSPEHGVEVRWRFNTTGEIPEDWETTLSLREVVNIKYSRTFQFLHSEPGTTYSYEDWKAGRTAKAIVSREGHDKIDMTQEFWERARGTKDPNLAREFRRAKEDFDHQFQTVELQEEFREKGLQVIVKLGGIELTPDNATFEGEDWHADGILNEHIAGVAVYCFDTENINEPRMSFIQHPEFFGDEYSFDENWEVPYMEELYGVKHEKSLFQDLGSVPLRQGGLIAFPNCLRHRLDPFELADKTRSGHCRFLTLWLVDPYYRICSTRNVPPQHADWWEQEARSHLAAAHPLPRELTDQIIADTGPWLMSLQEAEIHRQKRAEEEEEVRKKDFTEFEMNSVVFIKVDS
ncbi:hypothetical protein BJY04DRAFT_222288 [Aspergillus karnatakaensis]|uniref:DUF4246 domain-containing protein n=1 Tax=Aspergillus karnatakaensis TaxID=1810916 RepID=UPI003CCDBE60